MTTPGGHENHRPFGSHFYRTIKYINNIGICRLQEKRK